MNKSIGKKGYIKHMYFTHYTGWHKKMTPTHMMLHNSFVGKNSDLFYGTLKLASMVQLHKKFQMTSSTKCRFMSVTRCAVYSFTGTPGFYTKMTPTFCNIIFEKSYDYFINDNYIILWVIDWTFFPWKHKQKSLVFTKLCYKM